MDRERERERVGARSDAASLWIDFLLLPPKLEEHLAAGPAAIPSPPDLISMFLEQALLSQKAVTGGSSGNIANKEETQGSVKVASKTAAVLCERAARVAVAAQLTLAEIEVSLASQQHQFVLLKTLIRHDEGRSLLHQCNLHRWLIHKALQCHPVGSAAPNVAFPATRLGFSTAGDDLGEVFHNIMNGNGDTSLISGTGDTRIEEEQASVEFLEQVLKDEGFSEQVMEEQEGVPKVQMSAKLHTKSSLQRVPENGNLSKEQVLSSGYKCQVMFDLAQVHFMRGRIRQAYEFFVRCKESLSFLSTRIRRSGKEDEEESFSTSDTACQFLPVPQDRLAGFIVACRMLLLGVSPVENSSQPESAGKSTISQEVVPTFGAPSSTQQAVIACEQSRWIARRHNKADSPHYAHVSGTAVCRETPKRDILEILRDDETFASNGGRGTEDGASCRQNKRSRISKSYGDLNGNTEPKDIVVGNGQGGRTDTDAQSKVPSGLKLEPLATQHGGDSGAAVKESVSNGNDLHDIKRLEVNGTKRKQTAAYRKDGREVDETDNNHTMHAAYSEKDQLMSDASTQIKLVLGLKGESGENALFELDSVPEVACTEGQQQRLTQAFIQDILEGHLPWAYCSSVEKDPMLSELDRSKVAACNLVRSVLEGASVEIFLGISDQFESSKDAVEFLMQLLLAIKVMEEGNKSSTNGSYVVDSRQEERLTKLGFSTQGPIPQGTDEASSALLQRVDDLAMYVCCVIDQPWCWDCAFEHRVARKTGLPRFGSPCPVDWSKPFESSATSEYAASVLNSSLDSDSHTIEEMKLLSESDLIMSLVQLESLTEIEEFVEGFGRVERISSSLKAREEVSSKEVCTRVEESSHKGLSEKRGASVATALEHSPGSHQSNFLSVSTSSHQRKGSSYSEVILRNDQGRGGPAVTTVATTDSNLQHLSSSGAHVASILKGRASTVLDVTKDIRAAKRFYELALGILPGDIDCVMMLWLFERTADTQERSEGRVVSPWSRFLPEGIGSGSLPSSLLLDFAILFLIEKELWHFLTEICKWASSLLKEVVCRESELNTNVGSASAIGDPGASGTRGESSSRMVTVHRQSKHQRLLQTLKLGTILSDLLPLCISLQAAASRNHFNEDSARLGSTLSQLYEDFMCILIGVESDGLVQESDDIPDWRVTHSGINHFPRYTGAAGAPLISRVSNPRALMALASLTAGWLQRCHSTGFSAWPLAVERYGVLAAATAGAALPPPPGSLPYPSSALRPAPPRVPAEFGRDLFGVLLETIVSIPGVVEGDREKGHRWLQGLADLAFEDEAHVKALRLYLQAGAFRSAHYCDRSSSMYRDIFTRWVIQRMVAACRAIGAGLQAAVLCQCAPAPEHELAFRILQENTLIVDRDAAAYFECLWEVPILELLVNLHAKAGDEERVNSLIGLLQQPALNVHNPPAIRQAHICTMEQRFLQRLAGELLD